MNNFTLQDDKKIYLVSELSGQVRRLLESSFGEVRVQGELSNLARPASGHLYFSLKDNKAQIRCALFKIKANRITCQIEDGLMVTATGRLSLYENRGDFQMIVSDLVPTGFGDLQLAYEKLKLKLANEGLFLAENKKKLPFFPTSIAIITSATGAVIKDITTTCERRYPLVKLVLYPVKVQGESASQEIISALKLADTNKHDAIIMARGGGSIEDLWAFNDEKLARVVFACKTPIISGIGHDVDFTIVDFVADVRASTPTGAAELATPDKNELLITLAEIEKRLFRQFRHTNIQRMQMIDILTRRLLHPSDRLNHSQLQNLQLKNRLMKIMDNNLARLQQTITNLEKRHYLKSPQSTIKRHDLLITEKAQRLLNSILRKNKNMANHLTHLQSKLTSLSPNATLDRGYAIVSRNANNELIKSVKQTDTDDVLDIRFCDGKIKVVKF